MALLKDGSTSASTLFGTILCASYPCARPTNERWLAMADDCDIAGHQEWDDASSRPVDTVGKLKTVRAMLMLSQADLVRLLGVPVATIQNWEQRRTEPEAMARRLIDLIFDDPQGMRERLQRLKAA